MTEVWFLDRGDDPLPEDAVSLLPPWRRARLEGLKNPTARQESLAAGLLYAYAMTELGVSPAAEVRLLPAGKPVREDIFFSLSHSGHWSMCAAGPVPVGADVQVRRPTRLSIARRFHPAERAWLDARPETERMACLFRLWTRKEAWVKAVSGERMLALDEADVLRPLPGLRFRDYVLSDDCPAAVCAGEDDIRKENIIQAGELISALRERYEREKGERP